MGILRSLVCLVLLTTLMSPMPTGLTTIRTVEYDPGQTVVLAKDGAICSPLTPMFAEIVEDDASVGIAHPAKFQFVELADLSAVTVYLSCLHSRSLPVLLRREYVYHTRHALHKILEVFIV